ncbi:hypothetical protein BJX99DRAFT_268450 [Aspergillus californicus]
MSSRSRFRNFFRRHKDEAQAGITTNALPPISAESNVQSNQSAHTSTPKDLWQRAFDKLGDKERTILSIQALASISEVIRLTEEQYEQSKEDKRIRESSHRIINAALSFKDIISAVAASDPTRHAASAWAIVSLGLTIAQNRYDLQSALFESSEYLADVLTQCAYIEDKIYLNSSRDIKIDLGNALVRLYGAILHYTAQIRIAQDPSLGRQLLDCVTAITEHPLTELKASVEKERDNIAQWIGLVQYLHHEERSKDILDRIDELLESSKRLGKQVDLVNLSIAKGAFYDSYVNQHEGFCLPDTRVELRSQITKWAESLDSKCIFWLNGMAGTGKSTIARTKGEADRGDAKHQQLAPGVLKAIEDDPDISAKALREHLDSSKSSTTVIVIDALDECEGRDIPKSKVLRVQIFLTSRPELPVRLGFKKSDDHQDLDLHVLPNPIIEHDIRIFLKERFSMIRKSRELTDDWPGNDTLDALVMMAVPLFIFAATACRFIEEGRHPERRLKKLLEAQAVTSASQMDRIYQPVLIQLFKDNDDESEELLQEFRDIVGVIITLATPLSLESLTRLLRLPKQIIIEVLDPLHSVLNISSDTKAPVRILHLSFRDYLLTTESKFHVDEQQTHQKIALHCLRIMKDRLKYNICGLSSYGTQKVDISSQTIAQHLSADLQYSCQYWIYHVQQSEGHISEPEVFPFLENHFLHWLEALSLMGVISEAVGMIDMLQGAVSKGTDRITGFLYDAKRFILKNTYIARLAPLQLYSSGLVFSPMQSPIRKMFSDSRPERIRIIPQVEDHWSPGLQTLEGHSRWVQSVAFSHDSQMVASGSNNWVMVAGENILWLPPEHRQFTASAVTDATIALGYSDGRVAIIGFHIP